MWFCSTMGCILSSEALYDTGPTPSVSVSVVGEVYIYVPGFRAPKYVDLKGTLHGSISADLLSRLQQLRSQVLIALGKYTPASKSRRFRRPHQQDTPAAVHLEKALVNYLPVLLGFMTKGEKLTSGLFFEWTNVEDENKETSMGSVYYELLSVLHLLGVLALQEANTCLTPRPPAEGYSPKVTEDSKRNAIELLLKAASYLECALRAVLPNTPEDVKEKLPAALTESMLRAIENQALGHGIELQLGFAVDNVKASLAVKRRIACEHVKVWEEVSEKLVCAPLADGRREKYLLFVNWKLSEAKVGAYYFHGLILDEGYEDNMHAQAITCLRAAETFLKESQRIKVEFGNAEPMTKVPPSWGAIKYLSEKIPRDVLVRARLFKEKYHKEILPVATPQLPVFQLALKADQYNLPPIDPAWEKETGYEGRYNLDSDLPAFLVKRDLSRKENGPSELRRAQPILATPAMVQAR
uniref:BRO1 domain-containing protein n=3 Tax=Physcomitrium patens TaxID=3218 RepID=A0A7I4E2T0_PHYPA|nr:uncharacterized protein LOC112282906 isoform X1 [Physcomitrium patens]XP_024376823.1 uncharacterized protein LOC112282906 isoform X1 [Physcomitrium patens]XP_024376824.1 uncharacterized protein LOC112282906 isoform X1 [Physcomitrium patens]|eukprot:XP_024376822.1 uncharacterized protein LOC112282906 isoform X1 [Physcomitrella patens]